MDVFRWPAPAAGSASSSRGATCQRQPSGAFGANGSHASAAHRTSQERFLAALTCSVLAAFTTGPCGRRRGHGRVCCDALRATGRPDATPPPGLLDAPGQWWHWRGHRIRYVCMGKKGPPIVLLHGFGVSLDYYRRLAPVLVEEGFQVFALDWLGLGLSDKPPEPTYGIELWAELLEDFCKSKVTNTPVLIGNSLGSLVALAVAATPWGNTNVCGTVLLNCAGGMNIRHMANDDLTPLPLKLAATVITGILSFLLQFRTFADFLLGNLKQPAVLKEVLKDLYTNPSGVDDSLVASIATPAEDPKAVDVFVKILTGEPGPSPDKLMPNVRCPVQLVWGDADAITPLDGAYGRYFQQLAREKDDVTFTVVAAGHCPHDDNPNDVNTEVLYWLTRRRPHLARLDLVRL